MFSVQSLGSTATRGTIDSFGMLHRLSRFEAMPRLLDETELEELAQQTGFDPRLVNKLRRERRRAYSLYLSEISAEFNSLAKEAMDRAANDPDVEQDFLGSIVKVKARFKFSLLVLRVSLFLPAGARAKARQMTINLVGSLQPLASMAS